eukprot:1196708-Rhodomonas_salina.2
MSQAEGLLPAGKCRVQRRIEEIRVFGDKTGSRIRWLSTKPGNVGEWGNVNRNLWGLGVQCRPSVEVVRGGRNGVSISQAVSRYEILIRSQSPVSIAQTGVQAWEDINLKLSSLADPATARSEKLLAKPGGSRMLRLVFELWEETREKPTFSAA